MSYFVLCTFDLSGADSDDYVNAYSALEEIGLLGEVTSKEGKTVELPNTVVVGEFDGKSCSEVQKFVSSQVKEAFKQLGLKFNIFVSVGGNWCWGHSAT